VRAGSNPKIVLNFYFSFTSSLSYHYSYMNLPSSSTHVILHNIFLFFPSCGRWNRVQYTLSLLIFGDFLYCTRILVTFCTTIAVGLLARTFFIDLFYRIFGGSGHVL